jgi:hypothetical protein
VFQCYHDAIHLILALSPSVQAVCVYGGAAQGSVGAEQVSISCTRGFPDQEYSIMVDADLQKGQHLLNGE